MAGEGMSHGHDVMEHTRLRTRPDARLSRLAKGPSSAAAGAAGWGEIGRGSASAFLGEYSSPSSAPDESSSDWAVPKVGGGGCGALSLWRRGAGRGVPSELRPLPLLAWERATNF